MHVKCKICGIDLTEKNWCNSGKRNYYYICKNCKKTYDRKSHAQKYISYKNSLHNLKINGCAICGYNRCDSALSFHHVNPEDKKIGINLRYMSRENNILINELNKCILLCKNCHAEIHSK